MNGAASGATIAAPKQEAEAARLLRKLRDQDAVLVQGKMGLRIVAQGSEGDSEGGGEAVELGVVRYCITQDWLRLKGKSVVLTDAGSAWLRRVGAGDEPFRRQHQIRKTADVEIDGVRRPAWSTTPKARSAG